MFNERERATLRAVCDALIPSLEPEADDDETLFRLAASDLDVPALFETAFFQAARPNQVREFRWLLRLMQTRPFNGMMAGEWQSFTQLTLEAQQRVLFQMATHRMERVRTAFVSFKRLAMVLFYAVTPDDKPNPVWQAFDYSLPLYPAQTESPAITPYSLQDESTLSADVLVIGSGAGGGVVAGELAAAGHDVIVVEKGGYYHERMFDGRELAGYQTMYEKRGLLTNADTTMTILAGSVLGGGTLVNWSAALRPSERILQQWADKHGFMDATSSAMQDSFDAVSKRLNIGLDESIANPNNTQLETGCAALGYHMAAVPRNVNGCEDCGSCNYGCPFGAKQSTVKTYLQDAHDAGTRIIVNAHVERVLHERGQATGAELTVTNEDGTVQHVTVNAKVVVAAAGAIHTPALLMRSGLTNPNIGQHLRLHPTTATIGVFEEPIYPWLGAPLTRSSFEFADLDGEGYGVWLENGPMQPGLFSLGVGWENGRQHKRSVQHIKHTANIIVLARDRYGGQIKLDKLGQPIIHYRLHPYDAGHMLRGVLEALRIHVAAGAVEVNGPHNHRPAFFSGNRHNLDQYLKSVEDAGLRPNAFALFSAHQMSSCRIAGDAQHGAVAPNGESYEIKNLYVADGSVLPESPGVNPMLTLMSVAHFIAQQIPFP